MQKLLNKRVAETARPAAKPYQISDTAIPGFVLRVQPSGVKLWKLRYTKPDGTRTVRTLGRMPVMTHAMAAAKATAILQGEDPDALPEPASEVLTFGGYLEQHLPHIIRLYQPKKDAMLAALAAYFPEAFTWSKPEGGMFVWVEGPQGYDMQELYYRSIKQNVAFVPGQFFFTDPGAGIHTMRLNFTMADEATLDRALKKLADVIKAAPL